MTTINEANAVRYGSNLASKVYAGSVQVWPAALHYRDIILATPNLVGYWRLGESSGTSAADEGGLHPGVYVNSPTLGVSGAVPNNTGVTLNGTTQYVNFPDSGGSILERLQDALEDAALPTPSEIEPRAIWARLGDIVTIEAWVNRNGGTFAGLGGIVSKGVGGYYVRMDGTSGQFYFVRSKIASLCSSTANVPSAGWHHMVGTKNGATIKLYLDGVDCTGSVSNSTLTNDIEPLVIGHDSNAAEWFKGSLDEVALYGRAITASEVLDHYNARNM